MSPSLHAETDQQNPEIRTTRRTDRRHSAQERSEDRADQPPQNCQRRGAYRQAVLLAGRLMASKLWDGETPIRFDDVYALAKKMKCLTERDLSLFTLEDFVQTDKVIYESL